MMILPTSTNKDELEIALITIPNEIWENGNNESLERLSAKDTGRSARNKSIYLKPSSKERQVLKLFFRNTIGK